MKLEGRRESSNVDDRRGKGGKKASLGIGGTIIVGLIIWFMGGNPLTFLTEQAVGSFSSTSNYTPTAEEEALASFSKKILAGTEDVWTEIFRQNGWGEYQKPRMVLFSGAVQSGCGSASSSTGPFYCSADQTVYIDLSFFKQMESQLDAGGDFAYAYVIAHEVGHHVQYLLGTLNEVHRRQQGLSKKESNQMEVRLELQADFYAGIWAYHDNKNFNSIEDGDIDEGLNAASQIGDDRLQMKSQGYVVPDAFNHGTSAQRSRWLKKGLSTGNVANGDTFSAAYSQL
ncbi:putative metalloprotease [Parabacteroides sp. PF5-5]|uniref:KPN_02809 family neutral zinc metallopeptidase n=1 Tax=unclassified Parabacteroides TaxID=2649774 RepID=UPI0024768DB5|nr:MULTISPECIES: neutral zinc metallopeptidase [unclassified Parabacteroides]MDH6305636.1 putative metalloprotease [Parabacteroides sp. PH5-39]MDH6316326.1 putative metalloprotease [Parabacteroides sp. PF5-13]MDH6319809.1 putative metalloprotease [Parabacteroides sp. PH5-13]MDH6323600.1 putative metalloprotease [Parabacteroides sp. PH5-8]MDH6327513.1 putative metalloprotease [Parabacteroides sp. PH5-41]